MTLAARLHPRRSGAAAILAALVLVLTGASPASAHTVLVSSDPVEGSRVRGVPSQVTLTFSEQIALAAFVVVTGPGERRVGSPEAEVSGRQVRQRVPDAGPGTYRVAYRVVSVDGHPVTGELVFSTTVAAGGDADGATGVTPGEKDQAAGQRPAADPTEPREAGEGGPPDAAGPGQVDEASLWSRHSGHLLLVGSLLAGAALLVLASRRLGP